MKRTSQEGMLGNVTYFLDGFDIRERGSVLNAISLVQKNRPRESVSLVQGIGCGATYVAHCGTVNYRNGFGHRLIARFSENIQSVDCHSV